MNSSNTNGLTENTPAADEEFLQPVERHHRHHHRDHHHHHHHNHPQKQQQQQTERQRNATSKNYNSSTTMTSTDFTHMTASDTVPRSQVQTTRRPPAPLSTGFFYQTPIQTNLLLRTPTVGDGPPVTAVERKSGRPGQMAQDSLEVSTLPRAKLQTVRATNGEVGQGQTVLSQVTAAARPIQTSYYLPISSLPNRSNSQNPTEPASKSKNALFIRDRVQFFTRNELAAAVALNKSSGSSSNSSSQMTTPSKTNWFRRVLFK